MQGCCGSFSSPGRSDVPFWTRISKWTSLCAAGAFTSRAADYTVSPVVALAQLSCAVAVFFFLTHTPSSTVSRALSWFRAPEKPTWIYSLTRLLSSSAVLDICGRVLGKSRGGPCSVWLCHGLGRGPLFFVFRFHNAEASEAFAIQGCQALLSRGCMQPVCGSFSGGACICTGHISPSRAYLGCQILKKQKVSRLN